MQVDLAMLSARKCLAALQVFVFMVLLASPPRQLGYIGLILDTQLQIAPQDGVRSIYTNEHGTDYAAKYV
jgi:hypothetical protein